MSKSICTTHRSSTGRIIGRREGYKPNIDRLMKLAEETNTIMEINANPKRLDLNLKQLKIS